MGLQKETKKQLVQRRLNYLRYPVLLIFLILVARLWQLQIIQGTEYARKAENNKVRTIELTAPRGVITDRNRVPLVDNRMSSTVFLYREAIKDLESTKRFLTEKFEVSDQDLENKLQRSRKSGLYRPIIVKEAAGMRDISVIDAHRRDHPEVQLVLEPRRFYYYGKLAAHVLGYIGEVTEEELNENVFPSADSGSLVGQSGIERTYNELLVGKSGERQVQVDSRGREVGLLEEKSPVKGGEVRLTLDLKLQQVAEKMLEDKVGAVVAMDPRNGEILAMASAPSFDPNAFSAKLSQEDWDALQQDPDHPMQNRCIQNTYSPGSIFKLVMAEAGLEEGILKDNTTVVCRGSEIYYGRKYECGNRAGHGRIGLERAIAESCNIFFYELGRKLGISRIAYHATRLGLGEKTGIDLPGERSGIVPSSEWKQQARGEPWYLGETIPVSIGQGAVSTTPLQILRTVCALANGGSIVTPHLLLSAENSKKKPEWPVKKVAIKEKDLQRIREGMWRSVNDSGTGHNAAVPGLDICGKTGTTQVVGRETRKRMSEGGKTHAWFAGFCCRDNPEIAVVVFLEHGGKGGAMAAPIAGEIFRVFYEKGT